MSVKMKMTMEMQMWVCVCVCPVVVPSTIVDNAFCKVSFIHEA